jgi:hypothetical protein
MALEVAFKILCTELQTLREGLSGLLITIREDKPLSNDALLVDILNDTIEELLGWLEEGMMAAYEGQLAVGHPIDLDHARRALARCQEKHNLITQKYALDMISYERVDELLELGRQRKGEWLAWSVSVKDGLEHCRQPLYMSNKALLVCWQEIAERVGMTMLSLQSTNIA